MLKSMRDGQSVFLRSQHLVGRSRPDADLWLPDDHVSGRHAEFRWNRGRSQWMLCDLQSKNGTTVAGAPVAVGAVVALEVGAIIGFGSGEGEWALVSSDGPVAFATCEHDGRAVASSEGVLELPCGGGVALYRTAGRGGWVVERQGSTHVVADRDVLEVAGERWRVHLPSALAATATQETADWSVGTLTLELRVSLDEEDIELRLHHRDQVIDLPHRSHHALVLALCRERLADAVRAMPDGAHGWIDRDLLLGGLRVSTTTLDQYVHRTRKQFCDAGIDGGRGIIERRRGSGALRIGACHLVISSL